jgi:hypothetical protein
MSYYSPYFNQILNDANDAYVGAGYQYLFDITGTGGNSLFTTSQNASTTATFTSGSYSIKIDILTSGNNVTGYNLNTPTYTVFTGSGFSAASISSFKIAGGASGLAPTTWRKPSGTIHHVENIGTSGYRLLPNYALPNNNNINTYSPVRGGAYPGLSMQNGMDLYFTFNWSGA